MSDIYDGSSTLYTMSCWQSTQKTTSTGSPDTPASRLSQSLDLARELQKVLNEGQIALPSTDKDSNKDCIEIVVWYKTIRRNRLPDVAALLDDAANALRLNYIRYQEESEQMTTALTEAEVNNIRRCNRNSHITTPNSGGTNPFPSGRDGKKGFPIADLVQAAQESLERFHLNRDRALQDEAKHQRDVLGAKGKKGQASSSITQFPLLDGRNHLLKRSGLGSSNANVKGVETAVTSEPVWLSTAVIDKIRNSRGDALKANLSAISDSIREIAAATKTGWAAFLMVAKGIVTVGTYVQQYAGAGADLETLEAISVCASAIGVAGVAAIFATVIAIITAVVVLLKDCINILVLVNNTTEDLAFLGDTIIYGERGSTCPLLPKRGADFAYAAFFTYRKFHIGDLAFGLHGSLFGAAFRVGTSPTDLVSVGMDCPLTIFGGTNSVRVREGNDSEGVAWLAGDCGNEEDSVVLSGTKKWVATARRADGLGNANWGFLMVDKNEGA